MTYSKLQTTAHLCCAPSLNGQELRGIFSVCMMSVGESKGTGSKKRKRGHAESAPGLQLSLRASLGGWHKSATPAPAGATPAPETLDLDRLKKGQQVGFLNLRRAAQTIKTSTI